MAKSRFQGISLDSFLQMVQMDKTSCTLMVESQGAEGLLYIVNGELVDAECHDLSGPEAALEIVSWRDVSFEFENICDDRIRRINMPLMHLLMEGLKRRDDRAAGLIPDISRPKPAPAPEPGKASEKRIPDLDIPREAAPVTKAADSVSAPIAVPPPASGGDDAMVFKTVPRKTEAAGTKGSKKTLVFVAAALVILASAVVAFVFLGGSSDERAFKKAMALVEKTDLFQEKETIIKTFMDQHKDSDYFDKARSRLDELKKEKATKEYELAKLEISKLAMDEGFVEKAKSILNSYLRANPDSVFKEDVSERLLKLSEEYEEACFAEIGKGDKDSEARAEALSGFISKFPGGKHFDEAKRLLVGVEEEYYQLLVSMSDGCIEKDDFSPCVNKIESYRKNFGKDSRKYAIENLMANMSGGRDLAILQQKADALGDDFEAKRKLYYDYLRANTDNTDARRQAKAIIDGLEKSIEDRKDWESTKNYATNASYPLKERVRRLESFKARKPDSIYVQEASQILASMGAARTSSEPSPSIPRKEEKKDTSEAPGAGETVRSGYAKSPSDYLNGWRPIEASAGGRFKNNGNGTFSDETTGKTWCILDSKADLGRCLNYRDSVSYVKNLSTGGYTDWRLPTAAELYSVYKNSPAIPDTGAGWYWSSDAVWRGLNEIVRIVRPGIASEIKNETVPVDDCGYVRAVRN